MLVKLFMETAPSKLRLKESNLQIAKCKLQNGNCKMQIAFANLITSWLPGNKKELQEVNSIAPPTLQLSCKKLKMQLNCKNVGLRNPKNATEFTTEFATEFR